MHHQRTVVPPGLKVLLEGLSKAVVRYQPENIANFASIYFNALLDFKAEKPALSLNKLVNEFKATKGSHFYKKKVLPVAVHGTETFPHPEPVQEWKAGPMLMEARQDVSEPHPFPSENSWPDPGELTDWELAEYGLDGFLSATSITLSPGPILVEMAQDLAMFRRKRSPEGSPWDSPPWDSQDRGSSPCVGFRSALFERVSLSEADPDADAVLIRTGSLPLESLIIVQTEDVPDVIVFQADPRLAGNQATAPCCAAPTVALLADVPQLEVVGTALRTLIAPSDEVSDAIVSEPATAAPGDELILPEAFAAMAEPPEEITSPLPVTSLDVPVAATPLAMLDHLPSAILKVNRPLPVLGETQPRCLAYPPARAPGDISPSCLMCFPAEAAEEMRALIEACPPEPVPEKTGASCSPGLPATGAAAEAESSGPTSPPGSAAEEVESTLPACSGDLMSPTSTAATAETLIAAPMCRPAQEEDIQAPSDTDSSGLTSLPAPLAEEVESTPPACSGDPMCPASTAVTVETPTAAEDIRAPSRIVSPGPTSPPAPTAEEVGSTLPEYSADLISPVSAALTVETPTDAPTCSPAREQDVQAPVPASLLLSPPREAAAPCLPVSPAATQCVPCPPDVPLGETRTPYLVYLPLPTELVKTPSLVYQMSSGPEEARGHPFICVPMAPTDLPRTPSYVANTAAVQELPRTPSCAACETPRTPGFACPFEGAWNLSRNNSLLFCPAVAATSPETIRSPFSLNPQGGPGTADPQTQAPLWQPASLRQQAGTSTLSNGPYSDFAPHCPYGLSHGMGLPDCLCTNLCGAGSHWRLCHLTRPESQGRMVCPHQSSTTMLRCGLDRMANTPMYQDCGLCCMPHATTRMPRTHSSHASLHTHTMAEPRCPAHSLGGFVQPLHACSSDPLCYLPQHLRLTPSASQERLGVCPLACPLQQRQSSYLRCGHQGGLEQRDSLPSCGSLHSKGSNTSNTNPGFVMNCNPHGN